MDKPKKISGSNSRRKISIKKVGKPNYRIAQTKFYKDGKAIRKSAVPMNSQLRTSNSKTDTRNKTANSAVSNKTTVTNGRKAAANYPKKNISIMHIGKPNYNISKATFYKNGKPVSKANTRNLTEKSAVGNKSIVTNSRKAVANYPKKKINIKHVGKPNYRIAKTIFYKNGMPIGKKVAPTQFQNSNYTPSRIPKAENPNLVIAKRNFAKKQLHAGKLNRNIKKATFYSSKTGQVVRTINSRKLNLKRKIKSTAKKATKTAIKTTVKTVLVTAPKNAVKATIKTKKKAAETMINQGTKSTSFNSDLSNSPNAQAAESFSSGFKGTSEKTVSTLKNSPKEFVRSIKKTTKNVKQLKQNVKGIKSSAQGINYAFKNFQRAQYINSVVSKTSAQTAKNTASNVTKLTFNTLKNAILLVVRSIKTVAEFFSILGWIAVAIVVVVVVVFGMYSVFFSEYGIFISNDSDNSMSIQDVVREVNADYQNKVNNIMNDLDRTSVDGTRYEGSRTQWKNIIAIYAVKYASSEGDVITVDSHTVSKLKDIFYKFHSVYGYYTYEPSPYDSNITWEIIVIQTDTLTPKEVMDAYNFTEEQRKRVNEIITSQPDDLWNELIYGTSGQDSAFFIEVAKQQIGQSRQLYTSWYGSNTNGKVNWDGCLVSWCANEAGFINKGCYPKFKSLNTGVDWFQNKGLWDNPNVIPNAGDTIFMDWQQDGNCDICGIITEVSNGEIHYITTSEDVVIERRANLSDPFNYIMGYGKLSITN